MCFSAWVLLPVGDALSCSETLPVERVFIPHYSPLVERRRHLTEQLKAHSLYNISEFVEVWNAENITQEVRAKHYTPVVTYDDPKAATFTTEITDSEISLGLKHLTIYQQVVAQNLSRVLILEDDAVLADDFEAKLRDYTRQLDATQTGWGLACLGDELGRCDQIKECRERGKRASNVYRKSRSGPLNKDPFVVSVNNRMRTTGSYLLTRECAASIIKSGRLDPFSFPVDAQLNIALDELARSSSSCGVYWVEPPLVSQGSKSEVFESKARSKPPEQAKKLTSYKQFAKQWPAHPHLYQVRHFIGIEYFKQRKYKKALKEIKRALKLQPAYADAWYNRALVEETMGVKHKGKGTPAAHTSYRKAWRACTTGGVCSYPDRVKAVLEKLGLPM
jgi:GR25 family glycosyltransferase involved in LPS biosynthesis